MEKKEKQNSMILITSSSISRIGDILFDYASNTFLAALNVRSLALVGIYQTAESIVGVIFNLFGGVIADRLYRKKIIILSEFFSGVACILLSFVSVQAWLIYAIIVVNVLLAFLSSFSEPAYKAFTKEIVEEASITKINSYLQTTGMILKTVVPIVAIGIYPLIGIHGILLMNGISYIFSSIIMLFIYPLIDEVVSDARVSFHVIFDDLWDGFKYILQQRQLFILITLSSLVNFFLAAYNLLLPYGNEMFPNIRGEVYGMFLFAEAFGGIVGAFLSGKINKKLSVNQFLIYLGISGAMLAIAPFLYIFSLNLIILSMSPAFFNLFLTIFNIQFFSFVQKDIDNQYLGRVFGIIFTIAVLFMPFGTIVFTLVLKPSFVYNFLIIGIAIMVLSIFYKKKIIAK